MIRRNFKRFFAAKNAGLPGVGNPLFPKPKPANKYFWPAVGGLVASTLTVTGLAALIYGPYLQLDSIIINGTTTLTPDNISLKLKEELATRHYLILPNGHQWFFEAEKAEAMLQSNFPLKSVEIQKVGDTLTVNLVEDIFMVAFKSGEELYFVNPDGAILRVATPEEKAAALPPLMPTIREKTAAPRAVGDQLFRPGMVSNLLAFDQGLKAQGIATSEFVSDDVSLPWFTVTSDKPYAILFDALRDVNEQLTVLKLVADEYATAEDPLSYIDVRFGTRVYTR